jgi:class 3 adenylate cyclase/tetratricopeptide (TPR) repeat protein
MITKEDLEQALAAQEKLRGVVPDSVLDTAKAVLRARLEEVENRVDLAPRRKQVTVLFADLSSFTTAAELMDPEDVSGLLNAIWQRVDAILQDHGGRIDKHMGDAVLALWGADLGREDDAERAVEAALEILSFDVRPLKTQFSGIDLSNFGFRIAVHTGPVLLGPVGLPHEFTATGDTVNTASRLQNVAPVGGVLISQATYDMVHGLFTVELLPPFKVKGKSEPLVAYRVLAARPRSYRMQRRGIEGIATPLIGRAPQLASLCDAYQTMRSEKRLITVMLLAESGMGKSRLMDEFEDWLNQPALFFHARGDPRRESQPYALVRDLFNDFCRIEENSPPVIACRKLENIFVKWFDEAGREMAAIAGQLLGFHFSESPYLRGLLNDPQQLRHRAFRAIHDLLEAASAFRPVVVYLDDLHWADNGSLELLADIIQSLQQTTSLVLMATRPTLFERYPDWDQKLPELHTLQLTPLSTEDSRTLVSCILQHMATIPEMLLNMLVENAEGNPFYLEELIKMLIEQAIILPGPLEWQVSLNRLRGFKIPPSLTGVLQTRLDHLTPRENEIIQTAAIVGRAFWDATLIALQPSFTPDLPQTLDSLCSKGLIERHASSALPAMQEFAFKQGILHEVAYTRVLKADRRLHHHHVAEWLIANSGEKSLAYASLIADHYEKAEESGQAAIWLVRAGDQALAAYVQTQALHAYNRALGLLGASLEQPMPVHADPVILCTIFEHLREVFSRQGDFFQARAAVVAMLDTARVSGDLAAQVRALCEWASLERPLNNPQVIQRCITQAEKIVASLPTPHPALQAQVLWGKSTIAVHQARYHDALNLLQQAGELAQQGGDRERLGSVHNLMGLVYMFQGQVDPARAHMLQALEIHRSIGHQRFEADLLSNIGETYRAENQFDQATDYYRQSIALYQKISSPEGHIIAQSNLGVALVEQGQFREGLEMLQSVIQLPTADEFGLSETYRYLAQARVGLGELAEALPAAQQALTLSLKAGVPERIGAAWRILGVVAARLNQSVPSCQGETLVSPDECFQASLDALNVEGHERERAETVRAWENWQYQQ